LAERRFPDVPDIAVENHRISACESQILIWNYRQIDMNQNQVGRNELFDSEKGDNLEAVVPPVFRQRRDAVSGASPAVVLAEKNRNPLFHVIVRKMTVQIKRFALLEL
jgi:hypothetical protein